MDLLSNYEMKILFSVVGCDFIFPRFPFSYEHYVPHRRHICPYFSLRIVLIPSTVLIRSLGIVFKGLGYFNPTF